MLTAVKNIGEILLKQENKDTIDILLENPDSNGTYKIVWAIEFDKDLNFRGISVEDFKAEDYKIYLYRKGSGNSPDYSPTSRVTEPEKTFTKKTLKWFDKHNKEGFVKKIFNELQKNKDKIIQRFQEINGDSKDGKIITLKVNGKYLYEVDVFKKILLNDYLAKIKEVSKENSACSICGENKSFVFATSQLYSFFTTDKECYIAGGFNKKEAWKNFPVCEECFLKINYGRKFIEENLRFKFYNKPYYLIPELILDTKDALEEINEILYSHKNVKKFSKEEKKSYFADEDEILDLAKDYRDLVSFYFLFLKGGGTADKDRILLLIEDVLPSRIHKVFEAKEKIENVFGIDNYTFYRINQFLTEYDKLLFEVIEKIFKGGKFHVNSLIRIFMKKIRQKFLNNGDVFISRDALMNLIFFKELSLIKFEVDKMEDSRFKEIFERLGGALNTPAKKGIFLLGTLTQMLLNIQGQERESTPFWRQLKGLKMNEEDVKGLFPKVVNKLEEYGRYEKGKKLLSREISTYLLQQEKFGLTTDEINFYFVAGMSLYSEIANELYKSEEA